MTLWHVTDVYDLTREGQTALRELADDLAALGYAQDAARETEELLVMLRQWDVRVAVRVARLAEVWRVVSLGGSERVIKAELATYRGDEIPAPLTGQGTDCLG